MIAGACEINFRSLALANRVELYSFENAECHRFKVVLGGRLRCLL